MTQPTTKRVKAPAPYDLHLAPDGTSWTARENLTDIIAREILGPAGGEDEVLPVQPDWRYFVGRIAPTRLTSGESRRAAGIPMEAAADDEVDVVGDEDSGMEDNPIQRGLMIPASMGLRCQVPLDLDAFTVHASWGTYRGETTDEVSPTGRQRRQFRRTPHTASVRVDMRELEPGQTKAYPVEADVCLRIDRYDDPPTELSPGRALIEIALCNDREVPEPISVDVWMHQTQLHVDADGRDVFLPVRDVLEDARLEHDDELRRLELQYANRLEFAVGRTCSVDWTVADGARRATQVRTTWLPVTETPQTDARSIPDAITDMRALAAATADELRAGLTPIAEAYARWIDDQRALADDLPGHLQEVARDAIDDADRVRAQLADGIETLLDDEEALRCFAFMNTVMAEQRIHSLIVEARAKDPKLTYSAARDLVAAQKERAHSWRPFQLAFVLMQIPALIDPTHARRSGPTAKVELLFFPTGGGKTEAYLGLAAFTFAIRRRQGVLATPDGDLDGGDGIAVLMRYTLRLLTAQQFQRATTLICAAELERQQHPEIWGPTPFRIGLWVGTDVSPKRVDEAAAQIAKVNEGQGFRLTVLQIQRCPWCGLPLGPRDVKADTTEGRVRVHCAEDLGECPFGAYSGGESGREGLPVLTVDEEIYRLTPAFVIATVDKFARLAREGEAASLFGYVGRRCTRHGYVHPDSSSCTIKPGSKHHAADGLPAAYTQPTSPLRPPDLIIQDELHLITGALGTTVGLFEVAIDDLTTWTAPNGKPAKPLIVASSATVRNAREQVRSLYGRGVTIFPPPVIDAADSFFATTVPVSQERPGRRYLGVSTTGVRLTAAEIRSAEVLLAAGQLLLDRDSHDAPVAADPYLTMVGYFNTTRELAGMARYLADDVQDLLGRGRPWPGLPRRGGTAYGNLNIDELTGRVSSTDITKTLDQMAVPFSWGRDSSEGVAATIAARNEARAVKKPFPERAVNPFDVILATSMLQVGVDVTRLGLMLLVGQPKNTAEYIQASSRVGRDPSRPGLVVTLGNWARPRDLAHFEAFRHYHETFYKQVEALSVTPFSQTALDRGLDGVLVSAARVSQAPKGLEGLSPETQAGRVASESDELKDMIERFAKRIAEAGDEDSAEDARLRLLNRLDKWEQRRVVLLSKQVALAYERTGKGEDYQALIRSPEVSTVDPAGGPPLRVANSMREVQPEINLLVSPIAENLYRMPINPPQWQMPREES